VDDIRANRKLKSREEYTSIARQLVRSENTVIYRPVDRRDNYVKRCVGIPGDTITIKSGQLFVNNVEAPDNGTQQTSYYVRTTAHASTEGIRENGSIKIRPVTLLSGTVYRLPLTKDNAKLISGFTM